MPAAKSAKSAEQVAKYADMFTAMGAEPRLRIMQLLLSAHPDGLVVGEIQSELGIPNSTLSHHLDKLKNEDLVKVRRDSTFGTPPTLRRYKNCLAFSTRNAVPATRLLNPRPSSHCASNNVGNRG